MTEAVVADADRQNITPNSPQRSAASNRVSYLVIVILALAILLVQLAKSDPVFLRPAQTAMARLTDQRDRALGAWNDQRVGADVRPLYSPALREALAKSAPYEKALIVFFGPCTGCSESDLWDWAEESKKAGVPVVIVSRDTGSNIAAFVGRAKFPIPILADTDGAVARKFGAFFVPRAYAVSTNGELLYLQKERRQEIAATFREIAVKSGGAR